MGEFAGVVLALLLVVWMSTMRNATVLWLMTVATIAALFIVPLLGAIAVGGWIIAGILWLAGAWLFRPPLAQRPRRDYSGYFPQQVVRQRPSTTPAARAPAVPRQPSPTRSHPPAAA